MKKYIIKVGILLMFFFLASCYSTSQIAKKIPTNPTSYIYSSNISQVNKAVVKSYYKLQYRGGKIDKAIDTIIISSKAKEIFRNNNNKNDFYFSGGFFPESKVYFNCNDFPLPYYSDFHIHIIEIDSNQIKIDIYTYNSKIVVGTKLLPSPPHFVRQEKTKDVSPTTIEEYNILLSIGEELGIKEEMPKLITPK
jgi:hypothetical protein